MALEPEDSAVVTSANQELPEDDGDDRDDGDDDCVICYQTLYRPAKTECGHVACQCCLFQWALSSLKGDSDPHLISRLPIDGIKFNCPNCRTYSTARLDGERDVLLQARHPEAYALREAEISDLETDPEDENPSQTMVLMFGNAHRRVPPSISPYTGMIRDREWTFFVQSSRSDVIDHVQILLHPTFRHDRLIIREAPPFSTTHLGWGYFTIFAHVQLKEGWRWVDEDQAASSSEDGTEDRLHVEWLLDFQGGGSQRNRTAKFRKVDERDSRADSAGQAFDLTGLAAALDAF